MTRNTIKIITVVAVDAVLFAILLLTFAWFHHAKPQNVTDLGTFEFPKLSQPPAVSSPPVNTDTPNETPSNNTDTTESPVPIESEAPTPEPTGLLKGKFADKFTSGEVIKTADTYRSKNVCIEISEHDMKVQYNPVHYFVADIYIQDITSFRCAVAQTSNNKERVEVMARNNDAIVATSGDYFLFHKNGLAIRNGVLLRETLHPDQDVCVLYQDGTMETYLKGQVDLQSIYAKLPYHAWSFGPKLLDNGQPMTKFNTSVETWNPRCAIGYYEPGHYCLVLVDGRQTGYSLGLKMQDLSKLMFDLGCTEAYNLDGGMTAMMAYDGELISKPCGGGRQNSDILYIAEPLS
ncbi:MAG: phosphodiester glycosidase family protein [Clostridia bacterium]|nr:phosphodiester glycosidase family protein [Clostridia bacterium]